MSEGVTSLALSDSIINAAIAGIIGVVVYVLLIRPYITWAYKHGRIGKDIHKPDRPAVAESGGLVFLLSALLIEFSLYFLGEFNSNQLYTLILITVLAGIIGIVDDELVLSPK
jgi:UDP-N-acetylglucosamine--dolichyl-phosphate N-acetylglucosaminephosphotransferase